MAKVTEENRRILDSIPLRQIYSYSAEKRARKLHRMGLGGRHKKDCTCEKCENKRLIADVRNARVRIVRTRKSAA